MARRKRPLLDFLMNTIQQAQTNNQANPNEPTASPKVFDLIRDQIQKAQQNRGKNGGGTLIDMIKNGVEKARAANQQDPNQETAPGNIFDQIKDRVDGFQNQSQRDEFDRLLDDYDINESAFDQSTLDKVEQAFNNDRKRLRDAYAQKLRQMS